MADQQHAKKPAVPRAVPADFAALQCAAQLANVQERLNELGLTDSAKVLCTIICELDEIWMSGRSTLQ